MKLRYGDNAAGKTQYAKVKASNGGLVLTSRMDSWKDGKKFEQFTLEKEEQNKLLGTIKKEIFSANMRETLGYEGSNIIFKNIISKNTNFKNFFSSFINFETISVIQEKINLGLVSEELLNIDLMNDISNLVIGFDQDYFNTILGLSKFYASIKTKIKDGDETIISELNILKNEADETLENIENVQIKKIVKNGDDKLLIILRTKQNPGQEIYDNFIDGSLKNIKFLKGEEISNSLKKLKKYNDTALEFNVETAEIDRLSHEFNVEIIIDNDNKSFEFKGELSNGQFTVLATELILLSVPETKEVILDDVLETLDDGHSYRLVENIINYENIEILTHSSSITSLVDKIEEETGTEVDSRNFNNNSIVFSWKKLLGKIRDIRPMDDNGLFIRSLMKIISRYIAKNSAIHSNAGEVDIATIKLSEQWKHWTLAGKIFHYHPSLNVTNLKTYFPWIIDSRTSINTIEMLDIIIGKLTSVKVSGVINVHDLNIEKILSFFEEVKIEVLIEKQVYDQRENSNHDAENYFWSKPGKTFKKYILERINNNLPKRNNYKMHKVDLSPSIFS